MEKAVLWDNRLAEQYRESTSAMLDSFLELVEFVQVNKIKNMMDEKALEDNRLWNWLYAKDDIELVDIKKELSKKLQKTKSIATEQFEEMLQNVGSNENPKLFVLLFNGEDVFYISSMVEYYKALWQYLCMEKKNDFAKDLQECFPNIFFSENIETSINTLNRKFEDIREEIVEHLIQINNYKSRFEELVSEHRSYKDISKIFSAETGIECSPQAGREGVQDLKALFYNSLTKQEESITCELHTKFRRFNIDNDKQDRIYFFPGKCGIENGRIVVKHIGKHL